MPTSLMQDPYGFIRQLYLAIALGMTPRFCPPPIAGCLASLPLIQQLLLLTAPLLTSRSIEVMCYDYATMTIDTKHFFVFNDPLRWRMGKPF
jgi:hypothetical protein